MAQLKPVAEAILQMQQSVARGELSTEQLTLLQLDGRILAADIVSTMTVPAFNNSAMDGYALRSADLEQLANIGLEVVGESFAGHPFVGQLEAGQAVRIMTGAEMPVGADTVVMQEEIERQEQRITSQASIKPKQNVRYAGEDVKQGDVVLKKGTRVTPVHIGLIASLGIAEVTAYRKLKVALFSSGDELCQPGEERTSKQIYDSNRYALRAMLERLPIEIITFSWLPDDLETIKTALVEADQNADVVITSAGVSVGEADYIKQVLDELGEVGFWKVAMKPGKPFAFGRLKNSWFFGLPGNPVSSIVTLDQLAQPALRTLCGEHSQAPTTLAAIASAPFKKKPGRMDFQRISLTIENGQYQAKPCGNQGSGLLSGFAKAQGLAVLEAERGTVQTGETVSVQAFGALLS